VVTPLRLAAVGYLNTEPLVHELRGDPGFLIVSDVPSRVADRLHAGECDLGLIPSVEYAFGDYAIVPGISLASRGPVRSVNLYHRVPVEEIRRVALDTSSRTSVALTRVLLRERLGRDPEYQQGTPDIAAMLRDNDAALVIGDPALYYDGDARRLDLGEEWLRSTGLPFVFAFWAGRPGVVSAAQVARLQEAAARGLAQLDTVALAYNGHAERAALNEDYLRRNMVYALGENELSGLREFYRRAHALSLIPRVPELRFHGHS
jgi:chorismate dehydratase